MKSVWAEEIVAAWLRALGTSQNCLPGGWGGTPHKTTRYTEAKSLARRPPTRLRSAQLGDPQAQFQTLRCVLRAGARPGGRPGRWGAGRRPVTWAAQPSRRFPLQGLGLTSPAPGRTLVGVERPTHRTDPTIRSREGGEKGIHVRVGTQNTKTQASYPPSHCTLLCYEWPIYIYSCAFGQNRALLAQWQLRPPSPFP